MAAYGLYSHIQSNRRRSIALLAGLFFLVYVLVYAGALVAEGLSVDADIDTLMQLAWIDFLKAAPFATIGTALWVVIAYYFHQNMIDAITGGREVARKDEPRLYNILENLCISRGITVPKLKVMDSDALNAFATGMNAGQYSITVTSGLLEPARRCRNRIGARPRAHPYPQRRRAHDGDRRHHRRRRFLFRRTDLSALVLQRHKLSRLAIRRPPGRRRGIGDPDRGRLLAVAYLLSFVIRLALSRSREFLADAGSVELTKNPDAMISALRKIEGRGELPGATSAVMEMCIDNPREGFGELFDTHPSVDRRVAALVKFAGGHDPGPLALPPASDGNDQGDEPAPAGPWSAAGDGDAPGAPPAGPRSDPAAEPSPGQSSGSVSGSFSGPWGPHRSN
jgi:heat shock protein HtpX